MNGSGIRDRVALRAAEAIEELIARPLGPGLHVVATPIGNLGDITLRALSVLVRADLLLAEDTRLTRRLLDRYAIARPLAAYHDHNAERERPRILAALADGKSVALVSDAGTPLVSDPGYKLVRHALEAGHRVTALPGPSAVLAGLAAAGLPTDCFVFAGFLPDRRSARRERIAALKEVPGTLVLFEAPGRVAASLGELREALGDRPAAVARELTKLHEEVRRGDLGALEASAVADPPRGECVILVGPSPERAEVADDAVRDALVGALGRESLRDAVREVADMLGVPRKRAYDIAVVLKAEKGG